MVERRAAQPEELRIIVFFHKVSQENPIRFVCWCVLMFRLLVALLWWIDRDKGLWISNYAICKKGKIPILL